MEFLKEFLGEELYSQVADKLKGNDKVKLANLASGEYVAKQKFSDKEAEVSTLNTQLSDLKKELKKFEGIDVEALNKKIKDLEAESAKKIDSIKRESAIKDVLSGYKFSSKSAKESVFNKMLAKDLKLENDKLLGAEDYIDALKKEDPKAFLDEEEEGAYSTGKEHTGNEGDQMADMRAAMGLPAKN